MSQGQPAGVAAGIENAALRKLIYKLAGDPDPDDTDLLEAVAQAVERVEALEEENQQLKERIAALEGATGINLENAEYKQLSRAAKLKQIRESLLMEAESKANGKAMMDYNDVIWVFDGHPSPGHASELLKDAGDAPGYEYQEHEEKNNRVVVDAEKVP